MADSAAASAVTVAVVAVAAAVADATTARVQSNTPASYLKKAAYSAAFFLSMRRLGPRAGTPPGGWLPDGRGIERVNK